MNARAPLTDESGEVRELTAADLRKFKTIAELPAALQTTLRGRPKSAVTKEPVKIRLDADVLAALRSSGDGWQTRINDSLRSSLQLAGRLAK